MEAILALLGASTIAGAIITLSAIIAALTAIFIAIKKVVRKWRGFWKKMDAAYESIVGSPAVIDPETNLIIREARLSIGGRVATIELWQAETAKALSVLADNQSRMIKVEEHLARLQDNWDKREHEGLKIIQEWEAWRVEHMTFSDGVKTDIENIKKIVENIDSKP